MVGSVATKYREYGFLQRIKELPIRPLVFYLMLIYNMFTFVFAMKNILSVILLYNAECQFIMYNWLTYVRSTE